MLAIGLSLLGGAKSLFAWLRTLQWSQLLCLALAGLCLLFWLQRNDARSDFAREHKARMADRQAYERAQREAADKNRAQVAKVEQEQERITDEVQSDLGARLERLRGELRAKAAQGAARRSDPPKGGATTEGADGEAGVCLTPDQLLRGAENEERHDQLINWVERQAGVDTNPR